MASKRLDGSEQTSRSAGQSIQRPANDSTTRWHAVLAHDGSLATCDHLHEVLGDVMADAHILDAPSAEAARSILRNLAVDVCFVCLDLPPAPQGGIRFAQELVRAGCPIILVTRSLRWLPRDAAELKVVPWVTPEASAADVVRAIDQALAEVDLDNQVTYDPTEIDDELDAIPPPRLSEV